MKNNVEIQKISEIYIKIYRMRSDIILHDFTITDNKPVIKMA